MSLGVYVTQPTRLIIVVVAAVLASGCGGTNTLSEEADSTPIEFGSTTTVATDVPANSATKPPGQNELALEESEGLVGARTDAATDPDLAAKLELPAPDAGLYPGDTSGACGNDLPASAAASTNPFVAAAFEGNTGVIAELDPALLGDDTGSFTALGAWVYRDCLEVVEQLIVLGADPNLRNGNGHTPIWWAQSGEVASVLLGAGADPRIPDGFGFLPLGAIAESKRASVVAAVLDADPGVPTEKAVFSSIAEGCSGCVVALGEAGALDGPFADERLARQPLSDLAQLLDQSDLVSYLTDFEQ